MKRYTHIVSGARVEVRDDKVMDSSWKPETGSDSSNSDEAATPAGKRRASTARAAK
ncbi:hypothetical protein MED01_004269 [Micromonospora sp. MED01]|uniref:hypothetical protein n=1 Tax=Micromonospora alfalfae TaxID=2911212 RepID=UPI001EE98FDA|nr:hypothetical protein [Micromonospora alfalfae]MCG5460843.1 hypothetical protein [Micromonospora alfalfae]